MKEADKAELEKKIADYMDGESLTFANTLKQATEKGLRVVLPAPNEILIDIDNDQDYEVYETHVQILHTVSSAVETSNLPSPSGEKGHKHIILKFDHALEPLERLLLQAILGSDRKRELLGYMRHNAGETVLSVFFEKP